MVYDCHLASLLKILLYCTILVTQSIICYYLVSDIYLQQEFLFLSNIKLKTSQVLKLNNLIIKWKKDKPFLLLNR